MRLCKSLQLSVMQLNRFQRTIAGRCRQMASTKAAWLKDERNAQFCGGKSTVLLNCLQLDRFWCRTYKGEHSWQSKSPAWLICSIIRKAERFPSFQTEILRRLADLVEDRVPAPLSSLAQPEEVVFRVVKLPRSNRGWRRACCRPLPAFAVPLS